MSRVGEVLSWYGSDNPGTRSEPDALKFLDTIMNLYAGTQS